MLRKALAAALLSCWVAYGQPAFEVASIKLSRPGQPGMGMSTGRDRLILNNATLKYCIQTAYKLQDFQLSGGPKWMDADGYEIEGKAPAAASFGELILMLQTLLADRFQLHSTASTGCCRAMP